MVIHTADLLDGNEQALREGRLRVVAPMFRSYGGKAAFHGSISTLKLFEDNSLVRTSLSQAGRGRVLVIDGGGSLRCALVGDQLAQLAVANGWAGVVAYGCIRDARALSTMDIGVFALATHPLKTVKKNVGESDIAVSFGGVTFLPDDYLYADEDGAIVCDRSLH
ncbi:MAG TPA: ribonuclease E activity regulator RraA [Rhodocyclaceae bacterium]|nr:ribonuclease E activity regulator RraA [Rhodocyclaceae bacterium]